MLCVDCGVLLERTGTRGRWRSAKPVPGRVACTQCGAWFEAVWYRKTGRGWVRRSTCSPACHRGLTGALVAGGAGCCIDCDAPTNVGPLCPPCSYSRRLARYQRKNLMRRAAGTRIMSVAELGDRDGWRCHICRRKVNRAVRFPDPRSPSRDHLVPVKFGGTNDPENLLLAHWICNVRRGAARDPVQPLLVG